MTETSKRHLVVCINYGGLTVCAGETRTESDTCLPTRKTKKDICKFCGDGNRLWDSSYTLQLCTIEDRGPSGGPLRGIIDRVRRGNCFSTGFGDEYSRDSDTTVVPRRCSKAEWFSSCRWTEEPSGWLVLRDESMGRYAMRRSRWTECCTSSAPKSHRRVFGRAFGPLNLNIASCQVT